MNAQAKMIADVLEDAISRRWTPAEKYHAYMLSEDGEDVWTSVPCLEIPRAEAVTMAAEGIVRDELLFECCLTRYGECRRNELWERFRADREGFLAWMAENLMDFSQRHIALVPTDQQVVIAAMDAVLWDLAGPQDGDALDGHIRVTEMLSDAINGLSHFKLRIYKDEQD